VLADESNGEEPPPQFGSAEAYACPYGLYEVARRESPAYPIPGFDGVLVTGYRDTLAIARNTSDFSNLRPLLNSGDPEFDEIRSHGYPIVAGLVTNDPPAHTFYRRLVNGSFTTGAVRRYEPFMMQIIDDLIDKFIDDGSVELMEQFARPFPALFTARMLGVSDEDLSNFLRWSDEVPEGVSGHTSRERALEIARSLVEMQHYWVGVIEKRRTDPGEDWISDLVHAPSDGEYPLEIPDILEIIRVYMTGGTESTASMIGTAMYLLLTHPEQLAAVRADLSLIPQMLEEAMRLESPVQWNPRTVTRDVSVSGATIPKGSRVILNWGAANRDSAAFGEDAAEFDIFREGPTHVALGHARHLCVGAPISRAEGRLAFERLFGRLGDIALAVPAQELRYVGHGMVRRLNALPLTFTGVR
jgi:cytochrome P450